MPLKYWIIGGLIVLVAAIILEAKLKKTRRPLSKRQPNPSERYRRSEIPKAQFGQEATDLDLVRKVEEQNNMRSHNRRRF